MVEERHWMLDWTWYRMTLLLKNNTPSMSFHMNIKPLLCLWLAGLNSTAEEMKKKSKGKNSRKMAENTPSREEEETLPPPHATSCLPMNYPPRNTSAQPLTHFRACGCLVEFTEEKKVWVTAKVFRPPFFVARSLSTGTRISFLLGKVLWKIAFYKPWINSPLGTNASL